MLKFAPTVDAEDDDDGESHSERWLLCRICQTRLARVQERISDSTDLGIHAGAFVNPHGYLHALEPYYSAPGARTVGPFHSEDSWFGGYAWAMAHCLSCGAHLGWCFEASDGRSLVRFWGLRTDATSEG